MKPETTTKTEEKSVIIQAKFRMVFLLLFFYLISLVGAYITFPFVGFSSSIQNVIYGLVVGAPFWIITIAALFSIRKEMS